MTWWVPKSPETIRDKPFLHPAVVAYMDTLIEPSWKVLEHGSGGSTVWFSARASKVDCVEHDPKWAEKLSGMKLENVTVYLREAPHAFVGGEYDLLLIDGEPVQERASWIGLALTLVKGGGVVVLDNANRSEYIRERAYLMAEAAHSISFDVNPRGHKTKVTDFYRMKGGEVDWI